MTNDFATTHKDMSCHTLIIGAGPAGIAAAVTTAHAGLSTIVVDEGFAPGGQIWRGATKSTRGDAGKWLQTLAATSATILTTSRVVAAPQAGVVIIERADGPILLRYKNVVLCPGARELFLPFPGWTLPGVSGAGGLQALVKGGLSVAGKKIVLAGSGPLLLAVAHNLHKAQAKISLIAEQTTPQKLRAFAATLIRFPRKAIQATQYMPYFLDTVPNTWIERAEGNGQLERVVVMRNGRRDIIPCDHLACGYGLIPNTELPSLFGCQIANGSVVIDDYLQTSQPQVYCAGEVLGIGGVDAALIDGQLVGAHIAQQTNQLPRLLKMRTKSRIFTELLKTTYALRDELKQLAGPTELLCRCEDVRIEQVTPCSSWREAKLRTRCGMGSCQGRICGAAAGYLYGWNPTSSRPPLQPTALHNLCVDVNKAPAS